MHNNFHNALAYLFLIELGEQQNKADIPSTFLGAWLQKAQTVKNSGGWVRAVLSPATIRGPDNQDLLAKHPNN